MDLINKLKFHNIYFSFLHTFHINNCEMNNNGARVKIFYVKNKSTSKNNRPFSQESSDSTVNFNIDLSTFKTEYLSKNRSRKKDLTHLSTLLQRDKVDGL